MGIDFIAAKNEKFTNERDEAFQDELASENLLSQLADTVSISYRCQMIGNDAPSVGDAVALYKIEEGTQVLLLNRHIGNVMAADARELTKMFAAAKTDLISAEVCEVRQLSKMFIVRLKQS